MMDGPDIAIDVHGLTKSFGDRVVVRDLSMQVRKGTILPIMPEKHGSIPPMTMITA